MICKQCVELHKSLRAFEKHTMVSLESDMKELFQKASEEESTVCSKHKNEAINTFAKLVKLWHVMSAFF